MPEEILTELTPEEQAYWDKMAKRNQIESALLAARKVKQEYEAAVAAAAEPKDIPDPKSYQNRIIAVDGVKADLLGNISTAPKLKKADLEAMDFDAELADKHTVEAAALRKFALDISPIGTDPKVVKK